MTPPPPSCCVERRLDERSRRGGTMAFSMASSVRFLNSGRISDRGWDIHSPGGSRRLWSDDGRATGRGGEVRNDLEEILISLPIFPIWRRSLGVQKKYTFQLHYQHLTTALPHVLTRQGLCTNTACPCMHVKVNSGRSPKDFLK